MLQEIKAHLRAIEGELERFEVEGWVLSRAYRRLSKQRRILAKTVKKLEKIK